MELLPEIGVAEKKTHSSSVDDDLADRIRRHYGRAAEAPREREEIAEETSPMRQAVREAVEEPEETVTPASRFEEARTEPTAPEVQAQVPETPGSSVPADAATMLPQIPLRVAARPLRPPILGKQV
ncbi:MAG: hypothetical protein NTY38_19205, partial [Acidobacteria bacterium]|nr:hypothetical protein [Acidobacteriota bacterium]